MILMDELVRPYYEKKLTVLNPIEEKFDGTRRLRSRKYIEILDDLKKTKVTGSKRCRRRPTAFENVVVCIVVQDCE